MFVLGINYVYHQPSACLVKDGNVVAAVEEERFSRIKGGKITDINNTLELPFKSIDFVLHAGGITLNKVDMIGSSFSPSLRSKGDDLWIDNNPVLTGGYETPEGNIAFQRLISLVPEVLAARYNEDSTLINDKFNCVPHHLCHLASAFYPSSFPEAAAICIDGIGECDTTSIANCTKDGIEILECIDYPHSLGFVWEVLTNFLGFHGNLDECKVMGLAAYGNSKIFRQAINEIVTVFNDGNFSTQLDAGILYEDYSKLEEILGISRRLPYEPLAWAGSDRRHADLAAALQEKTNNVFLALAARAKKLTGQKYLVMAGGVVMNCVANGVVAEQSDFRDLYVQPAAGDAGTCVGAALQLYYSNYAFVRNGSAMSSPYLGPCYNSDQVILKSIKAHRLHCQYLDDPIVTAVELLVSGKVVGWFQGAMEFGPRALGNRSLLADPTLPGIRHILNLQVKHREEFRPFCPTILAEYADEWISHTKPFCQASRLMLMTYKISPEKRDLVPAIQHLDGTSRVQLIQKSDNPLYYSLIKAFHKKTGIPLLLNTSFNDREPIVCTPDDACKCYLKTRFDAMIIGNYLVTGLKPWERDPDLSDFQREVIKFDSMGR